MGQVLKDTKEHVDNMFTLKDVQRKNGWSLREVERETFGKYALETQQAVGIPKLRRSLDQRSHTVKIMTEWDDIGAAHGLAQLMTQEQRKSKYKDKWYHRQFYKGPMWN